LPTSILQRAAEAAEWRHGILEISGGE